MGNRVKANVALDKLMDGVHVMYINPETGEIFTEPKIKYVEDKKPSLEEMQKYVGGLIQLIELSDGRHMIINEEGKLSSDHIANKKATELAKDVLFEGDYIAGDAMVLSGKARLT